MSPKKPYHVAPGRKPDEIDNRIYELNQLMHGVWPPHATYICSRCGHGGQRAEFKMERLFGDPERRQCLECAKTPRPEPKPPAPSKQPKRPNRAAELAAARIAYEEEQARIKQAKEDDEEFEYFEAYYAELDKQAEAHRQKWERETDQPHAEQSPGEQSDA